MKKRLVSALLLWLQRTAVYSGLCCGLVEGAISRLRRLVTVPTGSLAHVVLLWKRLQLVTVSRLLQKCPVHHPLQGGHLSAPEVPRMLEASDAFTGIGPSEPLAQGSRDP